MEGQKEEGRTGLAANSLRARIERLSNKKLLFLAAVAIISLCMSMWAMGYKYGVGKCLAYYATKVCF